MADGSVVAWGNNNWYGEANNPPNNTGFVAVAAGMFYNLGLKSEGSIVAWGDNCCGQRTVPAPNTDYIAVAAGGAHSLGLKADGSIIGWGRNLSGQTDVPAPNTGFISLAAGWFHSLGLKSDGSVVAWGCAEPDYNYGQCTVPVPNADFIAVAAGGYHSLGIRGSKADYDGDGRIDTTDYTVLWSVIDSEHGGGPSVEPTVRFWYLFDMDSDRDVDLMDVALFANAFTGQ